MPAPILLSAVGSSGDLFPVLALARALERRGQPARLALGPEDCAIARAEGLDAIPIGPPARKITEALGLDRDALARQIFRDPSPILAGAIYPRLPGLVRALAPEARAARAVGHTTLAMAAPLAAELAGTPHVPLLLQPMMLRSALDPPRLAGFSPPMAARPTGALLRTWNRFWLRVVDAELRRRHGAAAARVRAELGLPRSDAVPLFGHAVAPALTLGLWDPAIGPAPHDRARGLVLTGFPRPPSESLPETVRDFLAAGPPPLVVTPGSVAHGLAGASFWEDAAALARTAGLRAVLLSGGRPTPAGDDLLTRPSLPHDALFPHAAAVLHHGGIGTTAAACLAARPQLIRPLGADQPDNAARIVGLGVGRRISRPSGRHAAAALSAMLSAGTYARAQGLATRLLRDGADRAAAAMLRVLEG